MSRSEDAYVVLSRNCKAVEPLTIPPDTLNMSRKLVMSSGMMKGQSVEVKLKAVSQYTLTRSLIELHVSEIVNSSLISINRKDVIQRSGTMGLHLIC